MSKPRKTVEVKKMLEVANRVLASTLNTPENRVGVICMIEAVLHSSEAYAGFRSLDFSLELDNIKTLDQTRREYFTHRSL